MNSMMEITNPSSRTYGLGGRYGWKPKPTVFQVIGELCLKICTWRPKPKRVKLTPERTW
jgi:hypothetical protein